MSMSQNHHFFRDNQLDGEVIPKVDSWEVPERTHAQRTPLQAPRYAHEDFLLTFLRVMGKRKWTVLGFFSFVVLLVLLVSLLTKPRYEAVARIVFNRENADPLGFKDMAGNPPEDSDYSVSLDTQVRILESDTLALQAIEELHLDSNPSFGGGAVVSPRPTNAPSDLDALRREGLLRTFRNCLSVSKDKNTRVIEIRFQSKDPRLAADVANAVARAYIEHNFKMKFESTMQTSDWLAQQLAELQTKVEVSQGKLVAYQKEHGILGIDDKHNVITSRLDDLNRELTAAQGDRIQKEANYRLTLSENPELIVKAEPDALIERLRAQEAQLKVQFAQATTQLGPANTKVLELKNQLSEAQNEIKTEVQTISERIRNQHSAAVVREKMIRATLEKQEQEANKLNENAIEYSLLKRDVDSNRQLYEGLLQKLKEAGVSAGLRSSNVQIVDVAQIPGVPSEPRIVRNVVVAVLLGLVGGIAMAFIQDNLDRTLRDLGQVHTLSPFPSLGAIPLGVSRKLGNGVRSPVPSNLLAGSSDAESRAVILSLDRLSVFTESCSTVLNAVLLSAAVPPKTILVTSAVTREGKTTTSINLAVLLARQGKRVLLVDADLRNPSIQKSLDLRAKESLSTLLRRSKNMPASSLPLDFSTDSLIVPAPGVPNLFAVAAGPWDPAQFDQMSSELLRNLLEEWRRKFDHVIIDTPPVLLVADAVRLCVEVDSVILVVRAGYTPRDAFCRAQEMLQQVRASVAGVVLNGAAMSSQELSYYGEYGYGAASRPGTN
jgi:succinoglycan biosynthesis transport protein ExoP